MTSSPRVFSAKDGLGNRLRALVGFRVLAELEQVPLLIHWEATPACNVHFDELFEKDGWEDVRFIDKNEADQYKTKAPDRFHYSSVWFTEIWKSDAQSLCKYEQFCQAAISHLQSLRPVSKIQEQINKFAQLHDLAQCTGVHIRMTDNVHAYDWWIKNDPDFVPEHISRFEGFLTHLQELDRTGETALVCTDNGDIVQRLQDTCKNVVFFNKQIDHQGFKHHVRTHYGGDGVILDFFSRIMRRLGKPPPSSWRTTSVGEALIEMHLLSRCKQIVGTYYSSFSEVSALLGGVPLYRMEGTRVKENTLILMILEYHGRVPVDQTAPPTPHNSSIP